MQKDSLTTLKFTLKEYVDHPAPKFSVSGITLHGEYVDILLTALEKCIGHTVELSITSCYMPVHILQRICKLLVRCEKSSKLERLSLYSNAVTWKGCEFLNTFLQARHCRLKHLDVFDNQIGDKGVTVLCEGLRACHTLETLALNNNCVGDAGGVLLGQNWLRDALSIKHVDISDNQLRSDAGASIAKALDGHATMESINITGNSIGLRNSEDIINICAKYSVVRAQHAIAQGVVKTLTDAHGLASFDSDVAKEGCYEVVLETIFSFCFDAEDIAPKGYYTLAGRGVGDKAKKKKFLAPAKSPMRASASGQKTDKVDKPTPNPPSDDPPSENQKRFNRSPVGSQKRDTRKQSQAKSPTDKNKSTAKAKPKVGGVTGHGGNPTKK